MRTLGKMTAVTFDIEPGSTIKACIQDAINYSRFGNGQEHCGSGALVSFEFDGVMMTVAHDSDPVELHRAWLQVRAGTGVRQVGPYDLCASNGKTRGAKAQSRTHPPGFSAPVMEVSDERAWQSYLTSHRTGRKKTVIDLAERWARLMQRELDDGRKLQEVARATFRQARVVYAGSSVMDEAVTILANCWKHGDQLRRWHSAQQQRAAQLTRR